MALDPHFAASSRWIEHVLPVERTVSEVLLAAGHLDLDGFNPSLIEIQLQLICNVISAPDRPGPTHLSSWSNHLSHTR